jgi:hypothetical protein
MGQFSWIYSDTNKQVIDDKEADTYLLIPKKFQRKYGKAIHETYYDGYGNFGGYDVYDLIADWNKDCIPEIIRRVKNGTWRCSVSEEDIKNLRYYYMDEEFDCELRWLGIIMACYDDDNFALEYPIKITSRPMEYEQADASRSDPNQGWEDCGW